MDKGWDDEAYFYDIDEPQYHLPAGVTLEEYFEKLAPILKDIKDVAPELKMAITYAPTKEAEPVYDYIDIWIPLNSMYDEEAVRERQSAGDEVWFYTCVQPVAPYPNTMFFNHLFETRLLMWQVYHHGLDGYLFWRSWSYRHQNYAVGYNGWGDGVLLYEDLDENVYDSIRWEQLFQSQEDYEYFWLLNETINEMRGTSNEEKATAFKAEINGLLEDMITNHKDFKRDPRLMYKIRQKIGNFIHQHSG